MKKMVRGRIYFMLLLLVCFFMGAFAEKAWNITGYRVQGAELCQKTEQEGEHNSEKRNKILPVVFYDDLRRKVCVRKDAVLQLSDVFCMEIPMTDWSKGQCALVEIRVMYADGTEEENSVHIQREMQE